MTVKIEQRNVERCAATHCSVTVGSSFSAPAGDATARVTRDRSCSIVPCTKVCRPRSNDRRNFSGKASAPFLLPEHPGEDQRRANRRVAFDHELRRGSGELAPGDLLVRHRAGVAAVARCRIADLAKVTPQRHAGRSGPDAASARRRSENRPRCRRRSGKILSSLRDCATSSTSSCTNRRARSCTRCRCGRCARSSLRRGSPRPAYMLPSVASSQPGTTIGRFFSHAAIIQEFFGSIW